jgi:hypothetical protein
VRADNPINAHRLKQIFAERIDAIRLIADIVTNETLSDETDAKVRTFLTRVIEDYRAFHKPVTRKDVMPKVDGKFFHCEHCGANVFSVYSDDPGRYHCNSCEEEYVGE